jgi:hypothetical protein
MGVKYVHSSAMAHARNTPLQRAHPAPPGEPLGVPTTAAPHTVHDQLVGDFPLAFRTSFLVKRMLQQTRGAPSFSLGRSGEGRSCRDTLNRSLEFIFAARRLANPD